MNHWKSVGKIKSLESHQWTIENFNTFMNLPTGSFITSPMITTNHNYIKWRLALFPQGRSEKWKKYLSVFIQFFSDIPTGSSISDVTVKLLLISAIGIKEREAVIPFSSIKLLPESKCHNSSLLLEAHGEEEFYKRSHVMGADGDVLDKENSNSLTIGCEVFFSDPIYSWSYQDHPTQTRFKEIDDFKKLLADGNFSDFTLVVGKKEILVHKAILANRSPVFKAILTNEIKEKKKNKVKIIDVKYPVMKELLHFIYTGTVDDVKNINSDLLIAADKYCVAGLKSLCEKIFSNNLSSENALERLVLADTHHCAFLKSQVTQYIVLNSREIIQKKEFGLLRSDLMYEIIRAFSDKSLTSPS